MSNVGESLLRGLLEKEERYPDRVRAASTTIESEGVSVADQIERDAYLLRAEAAGVVRIRRGTNASRHILMGVQVESRTALAAFLGVTPTPNRVAAIVAGLRSELSDRPLILDILEKLEAGWAKLGRPYGLDPDKQGQVKSALIAFDTIMSRPRLPIDVRTFSIRHLGHSKAFDSVRGPVASLLMEALEMPGLGQEDILAVVGLAKLKHPVLVSGPLRLQGGSAIRDIGTYVGLPEDADFELGAAPDYILTIENLASFHRYVSDIGSNGVVVYCGGYPSAGVMMFLRRLAEMTSHTPWFHWGDIDEDGVRIFQLLERSLPVTMRPHLMSPDLAELHGVPQARPASRLQAEGAAADTAAYLRGKTAKTLEQEALDPISPLTASMRT